MGACEIPQVSSLGLVLFWVMIRFSPSYRYVVRALDEHEEGVAWGVQVGHGTAHSHNPICSMFMRWSLNDILVFVVLLHVPELQVSQLCGGLIFHVKRSLLAAVL